MGFNFGISADSAVRSTRRPLAPWNIYDVKFMGCEIKEFDGKKDPSAHYKVLAINFENEDGFHQVSLFFPKAGDDERRTYSSKNGGELVNPSNFEELMAKVKQTAQVLTPAGFEKMQAASAKFKSFDDVAKALIAVTDKVKGTETKLKLVGRNRNGKVVASTPNVAGVYNGELYIADNYIGDKLFFNEYEEGERQKYLSAKPTDMKAEEPIADVAGIDTPTEDAFDLESLL